MKKKDHKHLTNHIDLRSQAICVDKNHLKKSLYNLDGGASGCTSGDVEQVIVKILFQT